MTRYSRPCAAASPAARLARSCAAAALLFAAPVLAADESDAALELARQWQAADATVIRSPEGRILFAYGQSSPTIVCAIFQLCDLQLEPGEIVQSVNVGDAQRWDIVQARSGDGDSTQDHVVIKPLAPDIRTSLFVGTDRRSYLVELVGSDGDSMGQVGFLYGASRAGRAFGAGGDIDVLPPPPRPVEPPVIPVAAAPATPAGREVQAGNLNFDYRISGDRVAWRPVRVFDDGAQTFIDFDEAGIDGRELPILLVNDTESRGAMINYRYDTRGRMIVDGLFDRGSLLLGKGRKAQKVILVRGDVAPAERL